MNETRAQALERILAKVDDYDFFSPPYESTKALVADIGSVLQPFLQNPDRHGRHVAVVLEYVSLATATLVLQPVLKLYKIPGLRGIERRFKNAILQPLKTRLQAAKEEVLDVVDPCELKIDLLPITSARAKADWENQGRRLVVIETRGVVIPREAMQLRAISHQIQISSPVGCQFVDAIPSSEMEVLGKREVSVSERGKFVYAESAETRASTAASVPGAKIAGSLGHSTSRSVEAEAKSDARVTDTPHIARIISTAVGDTAIWQLLRTPTQLLLGSNKFVATALVPAESEQLSVNLRYAAEIEGWGPFSLQRTLDITLPKPSNTR